MVRRPVPPRPRARTTRRFTLALLVACASGAGYAQAPAGQAAGNAAPRPLLSAPPQVALPCGVGADDAPPRQFDRGCLAKRRFAPLAPGGVGPSGDTVASPAGEPFERIVVWGMREDDDAARPSVEQRFAAALVAGNPEVPGGKIRHGAYYAHGMYWGWDPLSFLYLNIRYGLSE